MHGPLSLVGILVVCAGLHLLWLSRRDIFRWAETWLRIFRARLRDLWHTAEPLPERFRTSHLGLSREHVLRVVLGLSLVLVVGPVLIFLRFVL